MKKDNLSNMVKGWFIGSFNPTLYETTDVEVAIKRYSTGDKEDSHFHKIATEFTVIIEGKVRMNNIEYGSGDIIVIEPNEATDFYAITDVITTVVKIPGAQNDKYAASEK